MKELIRSDSLVTIVGLAVLAGAFVFVVYLPSQKTQRALRAEIVAAERSIAEIPVRVAELEGLHRELRERTAYLESTRALVPAKADIHRILSEVALLADDSGLTVTRLEPLPEVGFETYRTLPFRVGLSGRFSGLMQFLKGLESHPRLLAIGDLVVRQSAQFGEAVEAEVNFCAYVSREKNEGFAGFNESSARVDADNGKDSAAVTVLGGERGEPVTRIRARLHQGGPQCFGLSKNSSFETSRQAG